MNMKLNAEDSDALLKHAVALTCLQAFRVFYMLDFDPDAGYDEQSLREAQAGKKQLLHFAVPGPASNPLAWWLDRYYPGFVRVLEEAARVLEEKGPGAEKHFSETQCYFHAMFWDLLVRLIKIDFYGRKLDIAFEHIFETLGQTMSVQHKQMYQIYVSQKGAAIGKVLDRFVRDPRFIKRYRSRVWCLPDMENPVPVNHPLAKGEELLKPVKTPPFFIADFRPKKNTTYRSSELAFPPMFSINLIRIINILQMEDELVRRQVDAWFPDFWDHLLLLKPAALTPKFEWDSRQFVAAYMALDILGILLSGPHAPLVNALFTAPKGASEGEKNELAELKHQFAVNVQRFFQTISMRPEEGAFLEKYRAQAAQFRVWVDEG